MAVQTLTIAGQRFVLLPESDYECLRQEAENWEPSLPAPLPNGNYPAVETARALLARKLLRRRRAVGLTQGELAKMAGVRPETLNRIERSGRSPSVATVDKIDRALAKAEAPGERKRRPRA